MLSNRVGILLVTALAPAIWGTTYLVTTELLPPDRPLLAAVLRALPAGLLLLALPVRALSPPAGLTHAAALGWAVGLAAAGAVRLLWRAGKGGRRGETGREGGGP
nr:hypothetical protein [Streptomyces taklimakanensis]